MFLSGQDPVVLQQPPPERCPMNTQSDEAKMAARNGLECTRTKKISEKGRRQGRIFEKYKGMRMGRHWDEGLRWRCRPGRCVACVGAENTRMRSWDSWVIGLPRSEEVPRAAPEHWTPNWGWNFAQHIPSLKASEDNVPYLRQQ